MIRCREPLPPEGAATSTRRARELYRYFVPPGSSFSTSQDSTPDTVLTAHAQLVAWRLNAQRAMVSLIDRDIQYFVAESTKTLHLEDSTRSDNPEDAIWAGCVSVPMAGRLCEHTIRAVPPPDGGPAYFEVRDLRQDARFNQLPFVKEAPYFRYYCGVPLRTKREVNIGSLFILDGTVRDSIDPGQAQFLHIMAGNVLAHLESLMEKADRKRVLNMNLCLAAYVDPEHATRKRKMRPASRTSSKIWSKSSLLATTPGAERDTDPIQMLDPLIPIEEATADAHLRSSQPQRAPSERSYLSAAKSVAGSRKTRSQRSSTGYESEDDGGQRVDDSEYNETFQRAAELLAKALDLDQGSGLVFMDSSVSRSTFLSSSRAQADVIVVSPKPTADSSSDSSSNPDSSSKTKTSYFGASRKGSVGIASAPVEVIAAVVTGGLPSKDPGFTPLPQNDLLRLVKRHPRGKLFNLEQDGISGSGSSGDDRSVDDAYNIPRTKAVTPSQSEAKILYKHFPNARQIIFLPLWDPSQTRFTAFFAYNTSEVRTFSNNPDFLYCIAFSNCLMADLNRLATLAADQQKGDFIGSISHELRSPLHGILASCEFLAETETDSFQRSLIDTADSCGRTLLDTIEQILDYSKINAFERSTEKTRKYHRRMNRLEAGAINHTSALQPTLSIYGNVDLAAITEEVVEGVATGHVIQGRAMGSDAIASSPGPLSPPGPSQQNTKIVLDISAPKKPRDWTFMTQPGAFRRICMNLFGNSLKYTSSGHVHVNLSAEERDEDVTIVRLVVTDTGQGMSPTFLRSKLFVPFTQENILSSGTGLGLSIVRALVEMLGGEIDVRSSVGVGTQVIVELPMSRGSSSQNGSSSGDTSVSTAGSSDKLRNDLISKVRQISSGYKVYLYPPLTPDMELPEFRRMYRATATHYARDWYGLDVVTTYPPESPPDIIFTNETLVQDLLEEFPDILTRTDGPMLAVTYSPSDRSSQKDVLIKSPNAEIVSHPFGPYKLAKVVKLCLEKLQQRGIPEEPAASENPFGDDVTPRPAEEDVVRAVEEMTLVDPSRPHESPIHVVKRGDVLVGKDSIHAQLVTEQNLPSDTASSEDSQRREYPFPTDDGTITPSNLDSDRPPLTARRTISATRRELDENAETIEAAAISGAGAVATAAHDADPEEPRTQTRDPRLLLVDDNHVNLRLLQTFMKKRKYTDVHSAEDGLQALNAYTSMLHADPPDPPDIIFMDISMPVMNGFEATRKIREVEASFREGLPPMQTPPSTLIIALTGLASGRDQSEAFTSGFDLYLVKPISFKEVGRLLDNWTRSGGAASVGVPHGAVTGESPGV